MLPETDCFCTVMFIELYPERTDEIDFPHTGCPESNRMHRFNIRIKTINYDG